MSEKLRLEPHLRAQFTGREPLTEAGAIELTHLGLFCRAHRWYDAGPDQPPLYTAHYTFAGRMRYFLYTGIDPRTCRREKPVDDGRCTACEYLGSAAEPYEIAQSGPRR